MAEIELDGVTKHYADGNIVVDNVTISIADQELLILVGPSGCGKSTTLNMIAGLEDISTGELRIGGARMNERAPRDRDIAMVFQSYALYPHMTVRENMAFPLKLAGLSKAAIRSKVDDAADILELTDYLDRKPGNLSGGQRQRVAMGRAIVRSPQAFLMDEPLSNLDAKLRVQMRTAIARLQKSLGTTMVYVTHDQTEAMTLGDRIALMRGGVVQQIGSPQDLYERPVNLFVAGFVGSPSMNFFAGELSSDTVITPLGAVRLSDATRQRLQDGKEQSRNVVVGIRPEAFEDARLVGDTEQGATVTEHVDILESIGSAKFAYLDLESHAAPSKLTEIAAETGNEGAFGSSQLVAQLDPRSTTREGEDLKLWFDPADMLLFDADSGENLTI
ncbi:MAG TPA: sn-glycerol-3-phosphate ABC transporter ATP-binding protein UgpC [Mycobacteriales bacterium]|jgi:multiple sugar transport system ATP-binding protein|nr:sn-glycerol-3-phosphate ABC transporter ATP-binding protein UgpC [Mycobacteriales bacterium]